MREPYRLFFPLGFFLFLIGILIWVPQIWHAETYPVILHRYLLLNGFTACFIGGFLMTAVPKFSGTWPAKKFEVATYLVVTLSGIIPALQDKEQLALLFSAFQPVILLAFLLIRIKYRKQNPPYSFVFIFVGLILWSVSAFHGFLMDPETLKRLHYEGAVAAIILGVGSRLIPGILGHVEIVKKQRELYEKPLPLLKVVPIHFMFMMVLFIGSYFAEESAGNWIRALIVSIIAFLYWKLHQYPKERTALTWSIWTAAWLIVLSFILRAVWNEGMIHASHAFFINGITLLSFLIATRVLQSHGPQNKLYENKKVLLVITFLVFMASATRVSAYILPEQYLTHLAYSSLVLSLAAIIWGQQYLRFIFVFPKGRQ